MNKIDKQLINAINEWLLNLTDGGFRLSEYSMGDDDTTWKAFGEIKKVTLEANKQSILKAIMENKPKVISDYSKHYELGQEDAISEFESVIKDLLSPKQSKTK